MGAEKAVPLLGLHPLPGVVLRNPLPGHDPPDAQFPGGQYAHYRATGLPQAALNEGDGVDGHGAPPLLLRPGGLPVDLGQDEAVGDGVQLGQGRRIAEYHPAQGLAVDTALPVQNGRAKPGGQLRPQGGAGLQQGVVHRIRVDDMGVQLHQGLERGGLPRPGGAGDADAFHGWLRLRGSV